MMEVSQVLIDGKWRNAAAEATFHASNPATGETLATPFPISAWSDCDAALTAAAKAADILRAAKPELVAAFLDSYAAKIDAASATIVQAANEETGLPISPRLKDNELPRT